MARRARPVLAEPLGGERDGVPWPHYHGRFGGLWTDLSTAHRVLEGKVILGMVSPDEAEKLRCWIDRGHVVLEQAVPHEVVDRVLAAVDEAWAGRNPGIHVEYWQDNVMHITPARPELRQRPGKLLDLHAFSEAARQAIFAPRLARFLHLLFERPALAFQTLYFERGTQQPMHQDTAYVVVSSPMEMAASWIALEDIQEGAGELEYYAGSHRLEQHLFAGGQKNVPPGMDAGDPEHLRYLAGLHERAAVMGLERVRFRPRKGDVLVWHADLAHGGSQVANPRLSRRSLVTHYCPLELEPAYFHEARHSGKIPCGTGCAYSHPKR